MKNTQVLLIGILGFSILALICCTCLIISISAYFTYSLRGTSLGEVTNPTYSLPTEPAVVLPPTRTLTPEVLVSPASLPTADPTMQPVLTSTKTVTNTSIVFTDTLSVLQNAIVPINDPLDLAARLEGKQNLPRQLEFNPRTYQNGDLQSFWVLNNDSNENFLVDAALQYQTEHVYFWIQDGVSYSKSFLKELADTFETEIYPTNREFFGSEWTPGVDADPHLYVLYTRGAGDTIAGYYSPVDEYLPMVIENSNGHEMFFLNADHNYLKSRDRYIIGVMAHEFQHMIHWYRDRNEDTWMNEGFSDLAMLLNGYDVGGADRVYVNDSDIQLNDWPDIPDHTPHYGASFLFLTYFLDRFGEEATKALVADTANGMVSIDNVLDKFGITEPSTGKQVGADDVFADWAVASYLQDKDVADGRYTYHNYPSAPKPSDTETIYSCPLEPINREVSQYGIDYIRINCRGAYNLHFAGSSKVRVITEAPYSGSYAFYSNRGDTSDMTLTRSFDFTNHTGPLTFSYWTWYDLEQDYDYIYLLASLDGKTWQILNTPSGTLDNPSGNSYGWGYTGQSAGGPDWIQEDVDISSFAGKKVQLRFEYITDAAVNAEGMMVDDIAVPEIGYFTDFEQDDGGWLADGFVRIQNSLPQTYKLSLIYLGNDPRVERIEIAADNTADIPVQIDSDTKAVVVVISGTTRYTSQKADYQISITP